MFSTTPKKLNFCRGGQQQPTTAVVVVFLFHGQRAAQNGLAGVGVFSVKQLEPQSKSG